MITDAATKLPDTLQADVAIAGAGPAGIVLALELANRGRSVLLVEGGGVEGPGAGALIYESSTSGRSYPLNGSRLRWLGGTSNHWGGWVRPFDERDFTDQPANGLPGWPIALSELATHYDSAAAWCEVGSDQYGMESVRGHEALSLLNLSDTRFSHRLFRFSPPTRFGRRYRRALEESELIDCRVNLNFSRLNQTDSEVRSAVAATLDGRECQIRATHFVIAMGGVENPRFLLNQQNAPGNQSDFLGRCFMDHYGFSPGAMMARARMPYPRGQVASEDVMVVIAPDSMDPHSCFTLSPTRPDDVLPPDYWANALIADEESTLYRLGMINAPTPHPESRITLTDERDALGLQRAHLHWHLPDSDFDPVIQLYQSLMAELSGSGSARFKWTKRSPPAESDHVGVGYHHMGTTRMSASPDTGVVDANCRVWDRENLFVLGSSVFPSAGFANPTLTIAALASRLGEHLDLSLGGEANA